jgi:hypothetical protein
MSGRQSGHLREARLPSVEERDAENGQNTEPSDSIASHERFSHFVCERATW